MNGNIHSLLLSDLKGSSPSEWRQDGLFSLCYRLLFRYHSILTEWNTTDRIISLPGQTVMVSTLLLSPGPDILHCLRGQKMPPQSTESSANLTNCSAKQPADLSNEVSWSKVVKIFSFRFAIWLCVQPCKVRMNQCRISNRGGPDSEPVQGAPVGAAVRRLAAVKLTLLAAELPSFPARGGNRRWDAEESSSLAAVDHAGESGFHCPSISHRQAKRKQT